LNEYYYSVVK